MESEVKSPFETVQEVIQPAETKPKNGRKKKGKAKVAKAPVEPAPTKKKPGRPKAAKVRKTRAATLDVATAIVAFAGLKGDEIKLVGQIVIALQSAPKRSRSRIVAAIGKAFA